MKLFNLFTTLFIASVLFFSCSSNPSDPTEDPAEEPETPDVIEVPNAIVPPSAEFPKKDNSQALGANPAQLVSALLTKTGPEIIKGMGYVQIKDDEYKEIKEFTDNLVNGLTSSDDIYKKIFQWVSSEVKYTNGVNNDPYPVFKNKQGVCQGYANLLTVMLYSQDIPVLIANGLLNPVGGHAWNYVYLDKWYVSDPTNKGHFLMSELSKYTHLVPLELDADLFEDENFVFDFYEGHLNLRQVKKSDAKLVVPFSTNGFQVTSFNPDTALPTNVQEIYIGKNIKTLGESIIGLNIHAPSVKHAYVDPDNDQMESYGQVIYRNSFTYYIPASAEIIELKAFSTLEKNILTNLSKLETLIVQSGTNKIEAYAIENCPNLKKAYVPAKTTVDTNAFYGVHSTFQIIRNAGKN